MLLDCVYILEHHPILFLANFWALNCVGNFTGLNLFEPELDLNLWSGPRFRHLPEPNHRSSSRFMEILKEPDRTGLQQHYCSLSIHVHLLFLWVCLCISCWGNLQPCSGILVYGVHWLCCRLGQHPTIEHESSSMSSWGGGLIVPGSRFPVQLGIPKLYRWICRGCVSVLRTQEWKVCTFLLWVMFAWRRSQSGGQTFFLFH